MNIELLKEAGAVLGVVAGILLVLGVIAAGINDCGEEIKFSPFYGIIKKCYCACLLLWMLSLISLLGNVFISILLS